MGEYYTIQVSLRGAKPRIWRRFKIRRDAKFLELHEAIQAGCGWENRHLFRFNDAKGHVIAGLPDGPDDVTTLEARINPIEEALGWKEGASVVYVYDFGDRWELDVEVVSLHRESSEEFSGDPSGEGSFPIEDSGGSRQ